MNGLGFFYSLEKSFIICSALGLGFFFLNWYLDSKNVFCLTESYTWQCYYTSVQWNYILNISLPDYRYFRLFSFSFIVCYDFQRHESRHVPVNVANSSRAYALSGSRPRHYAKWTKNNSSPTELETQYTKRGKILLTALNRKF